MLPPLMTSFWIAKFKNSFLMFFTGRGFISCRFALFVHPELLRSASYLVVSLFTGDPESGIPFFVTSRKRASGVIFADILLLQKRHRKVYHGPNLRIC
jgi:predicted signal transduction protein with EAL and GGDEF domain